MRDLRVRRKPPPEFRYVTVVVDVCNGFGTAPGVANRFGCRVVEREFPVASLVDPGKG
jgi:hypothetical protein